MGNQDIVKPDLTLKQIDFINAYVGEARGNASKAARMAGYEGTEESLRVIGCQNLTKLNIAEEIDRILLARTLSRNQVLDRMTEHANASLEPFLYMSGDNVVVDLATDEARKHLHLLKKVKTKKRTGGKDGQEWEEVETEITLHDSQSALRSLGQHHRLWGGSGTEINIDNRSVTINAEERAARLQQILTNARARRLNAPVSVEVHDDTD